MLNAHFLEAVEPLRAPMSGTELMAPLLYSLVRSLRPRRLIEVGMGYTTPFIAQALEDNVADFCHETEQLKRKTDELVEGVPGNARDAEKRWFEAEPVGADPGYYLSGYDPHLYAFDDFSDDRSSAPKVLETLERLGLHGRITFIQGNPCGRSREIDSGHLPLDFAWNDATWNDEFFEEYWRLIDPDGGVMLFHNTVNAYVGNVLPMKNLKLRQVSELNDFEMISLVEPHKLNQHSFTMIRKISGFRERYLENRREEIAQSIARFFRATR
jgi:predicted O-methyltransferase YrrM